MINDAYVKVTCDRCLREVEFDLEVTAEMEAAGWGTNEDQEDICPSCVDEVAEMKKVGRLKKRKGAKS